ncbi:MAG: hypothetical protein HY778_00940 [Betaproteobacteria bacterium]|nr:hypothetical protein [Betaproteobacteria bacterium]
MKKLTALLLCLPAAALDGTELLKLPVSFVVVGIRGGSSPTVLVALAAGFPADTGLACCTRGSYIQSENPKYGEL